MDDDTQPTLYLQQGDLSDLWWHKTRTLRCNCTLLHLKTSASLPRYTDGHQQCSPTFSKNFQSQNEVGYSSQGFEFPGVEERHYSHLLSRHEKFTLSAAKRQCNRSVGGGMYINFHHHLDVFSGVRDLVSPSERSLGGETQMNT